MTSFGGQRLAGTTAPQAGVQGTVLFLGLGATVLAGYLVDLATGSDTAVAAVVVPCVLLTFLATAAVRVASQWERIAVLTFGKFTAMRGPGFFGVWPIIQTTPFRVDMRLITYDVPKQSSLSKDNIPVTVDAIVYYKVAQPEAAVLEVEDYHRATQLGAQTLLRDLIGKATLDELLSERERLSETMRTALDALTDTWGVKVPNVEIKEVIIAETLMDAIAREPAAEREKRARLKLAEAEKMAAATILEAAKTYEQDPIALQLRSMNMLYEMCMEGTSTVIFVPTETHLGMPTPIGVYGIAEKLEALRARRGKPAREPELTPGGEEPQV